MQHHGLSDSDVQGLHVIGPRISLLCPGATGPVLNKAGWDELSAELDRLEPDVLIIDPLISVMGGASQNDNAAAALFMGHLVGLAAKRRIGRDGRRITRPKGAIPISAESAMGAASFVNLSRIALAIEPLAAADAGSLGLPPWEARGVFRVCGHKAQLEPTSRKRQVVPQCQRATCVMRSLPIYPNGDKVGVVEVFQPGACGPRFSPEMIRDAVRAIDSAPTPPSPSKRATGRYAGPLIAQAIAPHRGGRVSDIEAEAVLDHLIRGGLVVVQQVKLARSGGRSDVRSALVVTSIGKQLVLAAQKAPSTASGPATPATPATFERADAGGGPLGPPQRPRGCGGNAGAPDVGTHGPESPSKVPVGGADLIRQVSGVTPAAAPAELAQVATKAEPPIFPEPPILPEPPISPEPPIVPSELPQEAAAPAPPPVVGEPADNMDGFEIPPFLERHRRVPPAATTVVGSDRDDEDLDNATD